jgi:4-hydroxy-tetrahydrodipicolinate synthase
MSAVGNLAPSRVAALCDAVAQGNLQRARQLHFELFELSQAIFLDTNPIPLKYMMARIGLLETPEVRLPLVALDLERGKILDDTLRRAGILRETTVGKN